MAMQKEIGMPVVVAAAVVVVLVLGFVAWRFFRPTTETFTVQEEQQIQQTIEDQYRQFGPGGGMPMGPAPGAQPAGAPGMPPAGR